MALKDKIATVAASYGGLRALGRDPGSLEFERLVSPTEALLEGRSVTLFGTNNYLGLTFDPASTAAAARACLDQGVGTTGSRIANGSYSGHRALEREIAEFYGKRAAIVFSTGYVANLGVIGALAGRDDHLLIDADSHASIYDACRMSGAQTTRFRHNDPDNLARRLERLAGAPGDRIIVVEGVYSMMGDHAPLAEIAAVRREAGDGVYLLVDEAHSLGVLGRNGRGLCEAAGVEADCDFVVGTFSKSVGTVGGFCVSDVEGFEALRMVSRPYMFTASMTPGAVASARAAFSTIAGRPSLRAKLWSNVERLWSGVRALGFETGPDASPVVAVSLRDPETAVHMWNRLIDLGIYTNIAIPPATPGGRSLLRVSVSAAHRAAQIDHALDALATAGAELGTLAQPAAGAARNPGSLTDGRGHAAPDAAARRARRAILPAAPAG